MAHVGRREGLRPMDLGVEHCTPEHSEPAAGIWMHMFKANPVAGIEMLNLHQQLCGTL